MRLARNKNQYWLHSAVAIGALAVMTPAQAQGGLKQTYTIQTDDLGEALKSVSRQSGREIMFSADAVKGKTAPPLRGSYTADEAVRALLAGSGLTADYRKDVILIRGRSAAPGQVAASLASEVDIVVTGSYIRGAPATSPVVRATRPDIERLGINDLATFSRNLPQNFSGGQNPGIIGGGGGNENVNSSSALNLRGLGPDATLTLINGHRIAYDAAAQGVDISAVPLGAIDRVEVVMDGTSALYGSDAIGGVANIILRRDFEGLQTSARFGAATDGGYAQRQFTGIGGDTWSTGGFIVTGDHSYSNPIMAGQRSYTQTLDRSATLFPKIRQLSVVVAGHQRLGADLVFEFDGQFNDRRSGISSPSTNVADVRTNGVLSDYEVQSYSFTPRLRVALAASWELTLSATHGLSETDNELANFVQGREAARSRVTYHNRLTAAEASAAGSLFEAPGGEARLALGAGYRSIHLLGNIRTISGGVAGTSSQDFSAERDAFYGFAETVIPIVGPRNGGRFATALQLTGALRYEEYRDIGGVTTPKLGLIYQPSPDLSIKASWGKSFKAPTLYQQFSARQGFLLPGFIYPGIVPTGKQVLLLGGGSDSLKPETARTWTAGLAIHPRAIEGLRIEASYFDVHYRDRIVQPLVNLLAAFSTDAYAPLRLLNPTTDQVLAAVARLSTGITNQSGGPYVPGNVAAILDNRNRNAATQEVRGIDLGITYTTEVTPFDRIDISLAATYLESVQRLSDGQPMIQRAGIVLNLPHWRGRASATWTHGALSLTGVANHIGGTLDNRFAPFVEVGSFTAFDAIGQLMSGDQDGPLAGVDLSLSVLNLFNRKPAPIRTTSAISPAFDSANYSSIGRSISLTITKRW